jgi:RNA polymerase sigma-70 factor (family 1)
VVGPCEGLKTVSGDLRLFLAPLCGSKNLFNEPSLPKKHYTEEERLLHWQNGEAEGFAYFFTQYKAALVVFASGMVKASDVAEDIVQESLLKLWQKKPLLENATALKSYFYRTVYNACLNYLKEEGRRKEIRKIIQPETEDASFFAGMVRAEALRHLYSSIKELPPQCAKIVQLYYDEGKDYKAIADELDLSINTVRNQRRKGIELLKKKFPNMVWIAVISLVFKIMG